LILENLPKKRYLVEENSEDVSVLNGEVEELEDEEQILKQGKDAELQSLLSVRKRLQEVEVENRLLREQTKKSDSETAENSKQMLETYATENARLIEKIGHLEEELLKVTREKDAFIETLSLLQDELNLSERRRHDSDK
jgi:chromosome segregation ATPase